MEFWRFTQSHAVLGLRKETTKTGTADRANLNLHDEVNTYILSCGSASEISKQNRMARSPTGKARVMSLHAIRR